MKKLMWGFITLLALLVLTVSCSKKDKGSQEEGRPYPVNPQQANCQQGFVPGYNQQYLVQNQGYPNTFQPNSGFYPQNGYYPNNQQIVYPGNSAYCLPQNMVPGYAHSFQSFGYNFVGTCDLRLPGRQCPSGFSCSPTFGPIGICVRYY